MLICKNCWYNVQYLIDDIFETSVKISHQQEKHIHIYHFSYFPAFFLIAIGPLSRNHYFHNIKKVLNKILTEIGFVLILLE